MKSFASCFSELPDPRAPNALHDLREVLFIALLATLCGATHCTDMALFARTKAYLLTPILTLKHGLPSHDTLSRVFRMLDPQAFERSFQRFMKAFAKAARIEPAQGVVAVDGKALRRGYERGKAHMPPVMVTLWAAQTRMALANTLAPGNNEALGAQQLIELIQLKGCVVTADALHCHRTMAKAITDRGGDYVLAVKENQPALLADASWRPRAEAPSGWPLRSSIMGEQRSVPPSSPRSGKWAKSTTSRASRRSPASPASGPRTTPSNATS